MQKSIGRPEQEILQRLLRQCRKEAGLTQRGLAERLQSGHSRISEYETGERRMDLVQLREYLDAVGVSLADFVFRFEAAIARPETIPQDDQE